MRRTMARRADRARAPRRLLLAAAALALAACQAGAPRTPPLAALGGGGEQDGSGLGGTGHRGGIGGTGLRAEGGLGGTGIVGTVTAFGSIVVQGRHIGLPPSLEVREETRPASPAALRVGQVVAVLATGREDGRPVATRVRVRYAVEGPVERVRRAPDGTWLTVAGQRVRLAPGARVEGPVPRRGAWAQVSGLRRADGSVRATFVRLRPAAPAGAAVAVRGVPRADGGRLRIGELVLDDPRGRLREGVAVRVTGTVPAGHRLRVAAVEVDRFAPGAARRLALEAYIQESAPQRRLLRVGGLPVRIGPATRIVGGDLGSLAPDRLVRVEVPAPDAPLPEAAPEATRIEVLDEHAEPLVLPTLPGETGPPGHPPGPPEAEHGAEPPEPGEAPENEWAEAPEVEGPETEAPGAGGPDVEPPEVDGMEGPDAEAPEVEPPETEVPETEAPETEAPEMEGPETEIPEMDGSGPEAPPEIPEGPEQDD